MVLNVHINHKAYQGQREGGKGVWRVGGGKREIIHLSLHCHHQNDSCTKVGSNESHFNVPLIVRDKVTRQRPQPTTFEEKGEPKQIRTEVPLLTSLTPYRQARPAHGNWHRASVYLFNTPSLSLDAVRGSPVSFDIFSSTTRFYCPIALVTSLSNVQ